MGTITIKRYQNKNEKLPKCYKKWYGKVVHRGTMSTDELANHIMKHGSVYTDFLHILSFQFDFIVHASFNFVTYHFCYFKTIYF